MLATCFVQLILRN